MACVDARHDQRAKVDGRMGRLMTMPTTTGSPAAVEYLAERMALDSGVRWRDLFNSDRNAWRYRAHKARHDASVKMPPNDRIQPGAVAPRLE